MAIRQHALYRRLENPPSDAAHGACYLTGSSGPCIDTGALIYMEGTLVLSVGVIREMAEVAGFNVVDGQHLEEENAHLVRENKQLILEKNEQALQIADLNEALAKKITKANRA